MAFLVLAIPTTADIGPEETRIRIERGRLAAVTLRNHDASTEQCQGYAQIWLTPDDNPDNIDGILLAQGQIGGQTAIGWTGDINLIAAMGLRVVLWCDYAGNFVLSAYTEH